MCMYPLASMGGPLNLFVEVLDGLQSPSMLQALGYPFPHPVVDGVYFTEEVPDIAYSCLEQLGVLEGSEVFEELSDFIPKPCHPYTLLVSSRTLDQRMTISLTHLYLMTVFQILWASRAQALMWAAFFRTVSLLNPKASAVWSRSPWAESHTAKKSRSASLRPSTLTLSLHQNAPFRTHICFTLRRVMETYECEA